MLTAERTTWIARCDKRAGCSSASAVAATYEAAADALAELGWYEARRKGGRTNSHWWCPSCRPKDARGSVPRST